MNEENVYINTIIHNPQCTKVRDEHHFVHLKSINT